MAKHRRWEHRDEVTAAPETPPPSGRGEQLPCLVLMATPDGYVVGRSTVSADSCTWISPKHVRDWLETRPQDVVVTAEKWAEPDGTVTLKPKRVNKGAPVPTKVGHHVVFGESLDAAALRAQKELKAQTVAVVKGRKSFWRHLCARTSYGPESLPLWQPTPNGEACALCGKEEGGKKSKEAA